MLSTKIEKSLKELPFPLYSKEINRQIGSRIFQHIPFEPESIYDPACRFGNMLQYFNQKYSDKPMFGQDYSSYKIKEARRRLDNFIGYAGDPINNDFFGNQRFDCIITSLPIELRMEKVRPDIYDDRFYEFDFETLFKKHKEHFKNQHDYKIYEDQLIAEISYEYSYLLHILYHLDQDGVAFVACSPYALRNNYERALNYDPSLKEEYTISYVSDINDHEIKKWMFENGYIDTIIQLPDINVNDITIDYFLLVLRKKRLGSEVIIEDFYRHSVEKSLNDIRILNYCIY